MRQYFYKSGLIISIFSMVAVLFSLCSIAIVHSRKTEKALPVLSDDYAVIYNAKECPVNLAEYIQCFEKIAPEYTAGVILAGGSSRAIYSGDGALGKLRLVEGRVFREQEYEKHRNVVMISEEVKALCNREKGILYYEWRGTKYRVTGIYRDKDAGSVTGIKSIFNLSAAGLEQTKDWTSGFFDRGKKSIKTVSAIGAIADKHMTYYPLESEKGNVFSKVVSNINFMLVLYIAVAVMILLNIFSATNNWLAGKRREMIVRKLVGADKKSLYFWLIKNYMSLVFISFGIGVCLVKGILVSINIWNISPSMVRMFGEHLEWTGISMAFLVVSVTGIIIISGTLKKQLGKEIIQVVRRE